MASLKKQSVAAPLKSVDLSNLSKATPYIQRIVQDAKLRENVRTAYDSSRSAYSRLTNGKAPAKALMEDKRLQRDLQNAVEALRDATTALTEAPKKRARKGMGFGRKVMIAGLGFGLALAGQREAAHQGAGHGVRQGGGVRVHAAAAAASTPPSSPVGVRLARRASSTEHVNGGAGGRLRRVKGAVAGAWRSRRRGAPVESPAWRRQPNLARAVRATRRRGSSRRCARAWPRAASPARPSITSPARPASRAASCTTTSAPRRRLLIEVVRRECEVRTERLEEAIEAAETPRTCSTRSCAASRTGWDDGPGPGDGLRDADAGQRNEEIAAETGRAGTAHSGAPGRRARAQARGRRAGVAGRAGLAAMFLFALADGIMVRRLSEPELGPAAADRAGHHRRPRGPQLTGHAAHPYDRRIPPRSLERLRPPAWRRNPRGSAFK